MPRLSTAAVASAIHHLSGLKLSSNVASAISCFLVAKRLETQGVGPSARPAAISDYDQAVNEMFVLAPTIGINGGRPATGRLDPFKPLDQMWQSTQNSGRKTVWNVASRGDGVARQLFGNADGKPHPKGGLVTDAAEKLSAIIESHGAHKPHATAIAALLLRDWDFDSPPDAERLLSKLEDHLGVTRKELGSFSTLSGPSPVDLTPGPPWTIDELPPDLRPAQTSRPLVGVEPAALADPQDWHKQWVAEHPLEVEEADPQDWHKRWVADHPLEVEEVVDRMVVNAIRSSRSVLLVGPPGTGKTRLVKELIARIAADPAAYGFDQLSEPMVATPDESWTTRELVGGETVVDGELAFSTGIVLDAIRKNSWLILDEINRADMDRIFGGLFTWLSNGEIQPISGGEVRVGKTGESQGNLDIILGWTNERHCIVENGDYADPARPAKFLAGRDWRLIGTYNVTDAQRVFKFGHALGRRFARVPISPPEPRLFLEAARARCRQLGMDEGLAARVATLYRAHLDPKLELPQQGPGAFLSMLNYIHAAGAPAVRLAATDGAAAVHESLASSPQVPSSLAEAYVIGLGHYLKQDRVNIDELKKEVVSDIGLSEADWTWVIATSQHA